MEAWSPVNVTARPAPGERSGEVQPMYTELAWADNHSNLTVHTVNSSLQLDAGNSVDYSQQWTTHPSFRIMEELARYFMPVIVVFGNFSNLLALVILRRKNMRQHSVCFYMSAYSIANILVLNLIFGIYWFCQVLDRPYISGISDWGCRLWSFLSNVIIYCGIWFVVMLSIDRFIYLCYTHKAATYCTVFAAKVITVIVLIVLVVVSIHAMWTFELQPQGCFVSYSQDDLHITIWPLWSATIYSYLPLTLLLFVNIVLSLSLCLKRHRQRRSQSVRNVDDFAITTLVISSSFFLLTVPPTIINVVDIYFPMSWLSLDLVGEIEMTKKIMEIMSSINHTLLGVVLLTFSRAFREEIYTVVNTIQLKRRPKVYEMGNLSSSAERGVGPTTSSTSNGTSTNGRPTEACTSSRNRIEYEVCNSSDISTV